MPYLALLLSYYLILLTYSVDTHTYQVDDSKHKYSMMKLGIYLKHVFFNHCLYILFQFMIFGR